eukprot:1045769-Alexandrium_andersonii.AAC.1
MLPDVIRSLLEQIIVVCLLPGVLRSRLALRDGAQGPGVALGAALELGATVRALAGVALAAAPLPGIAQELAGAAH